MVNNHGKEKNKNINENFRNRYSVSEKTYQKGKRTNDTNRVLFNGM